MAEFSLSSARARVDLAQLHDAEGRLVLLPTPTVAYYLSQGHTSVTLTVNLAPGVRSGGWLTVTEAARRMLPDLRPAQDAADERRLLSEAKANITRACNRGRIRHEGRGPRRRIDPQSFDAWCLARRRRADLG